MRPIFNKTYRLLKPTTHIALGLIICWGLVLVLAQIKPFWMDEWRLLYNLKFKTVPALFGRLDFTQQFPRVYLVLLKCFTAPFDYSYFTLRFPAFITGVGSIVLAYRLMNRIYGTTLPERYLFLLIIIASPTFLKYFVQIKQYEMEMFLGLVGIWQLIKMMDIAKGISPGRRGYALLCLSFLIAPFFSYTYPIVIAPAFLLIAVRYIRLLYNGPLAMCKRTLLLLDFPLFLCIMSTVVFYVVDVSQVLKDTGMNCFWQDRLMSNNNHILLTFFRNVWDFFSSPGSGIFFKLVFSVLGLSGFVSALAKSKKLFTASNDIGAYVVLYAALLVSVVIALFVMGKLPLGEPRLNAFTFPAIAILIIHLLGQLRSLSPPVKVSVAFSALLYAGLFGNVLTTIIQTFTDNDYSKAVRIYSNTEEAIIVAQAYRLPIIISPDVAYPNDIVSDIPCLEPIDAASVLKTFPAYKERFNVPVFSVNDPKADRRLLPPGVVTGIVGDGTNYKLVREPVAHW